jgi:cell division protease FtsH
MSNISPIQLELIDAEVRKLVLSSYDVAQRVVQQNEGAMLELIETLVEQETLSGVALEALLSAVVPYEGELMMPSNNGDARL